MVLSVTDFDTAPLSDELNVAVRFLAIDLMRRLCIQQRHVHLNALRLVARGVRVYLQKL